MTIESASNFFIGSILYMLAIVVIVAGVTFINNIISKYWKPVKIWLPQYLQEPQPRFATEEELERVAPILDEKEKMIDCIVLGDSIAVGTQLQRYECVSYSKGGINTSQWNKTYSDKDLSAGTVIISLGTNDHKYIKTEQELLSIRNNVKAKKVFWIMPPCNDKFCKSDINTVVKKIAEANGDMIIGTNRVQADGIHPSWAGYRELAEKTK